MGEGISKPVFQKKRKHQKLYVFKGVEPQLRHLEPVGGKSTLAHLSVHLHILCRKLRKTITLTTFDHFCPLLENSAGKKKIGTSGYFEKEKNGKRNSLNF